MRYKGKKGKLWKLVTEYVRKRDNYTCITCARRSEGQGMHAGHFIPTGVVGSNNTLNWDPMNIHAQCFSCNVNRGGWGERYAEVMELKYGKDTVEEMRARRFKVDPVKDWDTLLKEYQERLDQMV